MTDAYRNPGESLPPAQSLRGAVNTFLDPNYMLRDWEMVGREPGVSWVEPDVPAPPPEVLENFEGNVQGGNFAYHLMVGQQSPPDNDDLILGGAEITGTLEQGGLPIVASLVLFREISLGKGAEPTIVPVPGSMYIRYGVTIDKDTFGQPIYDVAKVTGRLPENPDEDSPIESEPRSVEPEEAGSLERYLIDLIDNK